MSQCEPPLRPMPVKRLTAAAVLMVVACIGGYLLTPKWQAVRQEQARLADPLHAFSDENIQEKQLLSLQSQIRTTPQDGVLWAQLGNIIFGKMRITMHCWPMSRRCVFGENAEIYSALATVLYYRAGQHMTPQTREMIDKSPRRWTVTKSPR